MNLTPKQVVQWLREQANQLNQTADMIEGNFGAPAKVSAPVRSPVPVPVFGGSGPTPETIKGVIRLRSMRLGDLAKHFSVTPESLKPLIAPENGLKFVERGWIKEA